MTKKDFWYLMVGMVIGAMLSIASFTAVTTANATAPTQSDSCKIYYNKSKELAEKGAEDLPPGQTLSFDPRIAKSKASLAYSQIYRNCKEYGE